MGRRKPEIVLDADGYWDDPAWPQGLECITYEELMRRWDESAKASLITEVPDDRHQQEIRDA